MGGAIFFLVLLLELAFLLTGAFEAGGSLLSTVPPSVAFLFPQKGMPLPWALGCVSPLFGNRAEPLASWFVSIPLESDRERALVGKS